MINKNFRVLLGVMAVALFASTASAGGIDVDGLLGNGSFENTPFAGAEEAGVGSDWTGFSNFGGPFRIQCPGSVAGDPCNEPIGSSTGAYDGSVVLKVFGTSGAYQDFAASEGDSYEGSVWALNPNNADVLTNSQIGFALIIFLDAGGNAIGTEVSNVLTSADTIDSWTQLSVFGIAPADTATVRFQIMTDSNGDGGGAVRFDGAYFNAAQVPVPAAVWLFGSGLVGLMGMRRKNAA